MIAELPQHERIVITGVGLTAPNGNNLGEFRDSLLAGRSGVTPYEIRYVGPTLAGVCNFDELRYQKKKDLRRGTRAGSVGIYCAHEAIADAGLDWPNVDKSTVGIYIGVTEHGNVETENEIYELSGFDYDTKFWSHHHNPRTVANNPAGEITLNLGIDRAALHHRRRLRGRQRGHHPGRANAAAGRVRRGTGRRRFGKHSHVRHLRQLQEPRRTGHARRSGTGLAPVRHAAQRHRRGRGRLPVRAGTIQRCPAAGSEDLRRGGRLCDEQRRQRLRAAQSPAAGRVHATGVARAHLAAEQVDIVSSHATGTSSGDVQECVALRRVFGGSPTTLINNAKSFIGHTMGAAGALELGGNLPSFADGVCHPTINVDELDPECALDGLVMREPRETKQVDVILNNSFGMLGINSVVVIKRI